MKKQIKFWNRKKACEEVEFVYGELPIRLLYGNPIGRAISNIIAKNSWVSSLYGSYQNTRHSQKKIRPFIQQFSVNMADYEKRNYPSFNHFFTRKFKKNSRSFVQTESQIPAFCEGRYLAYEKLSSKKSIPVKGLWLPVDKILGRKKWADTFRNGPCYVARLCPTDYHRFHYIDESTLLEHYHLNGKFHSVNPIALKFKKNILFTNERQVSILETKNFGKIAYIEVGALFVSTIIQSNFFKQSQRGDEKGYFLFGGSTVILIGEENKWMPDTDIIKKTKQKTECFIQLGEKIGEKIPHD